MDLLLLSEFIRIAMLKVFLMNFRVADFMQIFTVNTINYLFLILFDFEIIEIS